MAGETIKDYGSWVDLTTSGGAVSNNSFLAATAANFSLATDGGNRPHLEFECELTFGTAPTANTAVVLHHAPLSTFSGVDARDPSATNMGGSLSIMSVDSVTTAQRFRFVVLNAPGNSKYWLQNSGTGQSISAGWKLRARAWTLKPA